MYWYQGHYQDLNDDNLNPDIIIICLRLVLIL